MNPIDVSSEEFRRLCERVVEMAAGYLDTMNSRPILPEESGAEMERIYRTPLPETGMREEAVNGLADVLRHSRAQNGRFFGYVMGSGEPVAAAMDLLCGVLNQNVTAWRSAPAGVTLERTVVGWLAEAIGCREFQGVLTGGGSAANLMALAMAREAVAPANETGIRSNGALAVYASSEVHMSISKAIALLGIGTENLRLVPVDDSFRLIPERLEEVMRADKHRGVTPMAVVATAGTVNTGAIDPLPGIAAVAARHGAWLHIDGAYGALASIAVPEKFEGLAQADSISLDPHKWLYQPIDCGCLLYRDPVAARRAFSRTGDYARALSTDPVEGLALFEESIELSRRFRALKLWFSLRYHGLAALRESIEKDLRHARRLAALIEQEPELQIMAPVELSAVCFLYAGSGDLPEPKLKELNLEILRRIIARGQIYLSNATLQSKFCLRACITNHRTTDSDIDCVPVEVLAVAREIL
ncbi:MAG TPA: pyridoxal-dependent decarboxylase [Candidatus Acidoferrales bacterium]|nr:pyridoxal-dependent decarboxylase [Candidatus Acidoferrales bacterium]